MQPKPISSSRQAALIEMNVRWLCQALLLLDRLDDAAYATSPAGLAPHRAGSHLRHVLEFYQCFLDGVDSLRIDYDARRRDAAIEQSRGAAAAAIVSIIRSLEQSPTLRAESVVWVRMEDAEGAAVRDDFMESSISRELQVLSGHTLHHFALMAVTLRLHGVETGADFGVAPSTLRYRAARAA